MTKSISKILGVAALTFTMAVSGEQTLTWGQSGGPKGRQDQAPAAAQAPAAKLGNETSRSVARLADVLKRHQPRRSGVDGDRMQIYMLDLVAGGTTLVADESVHGFTWSGSPAWSHDGTRIVFDAAPGTEWSRSRLMSITVVDGRPKFTDLGPGNCPTFSPDDKRLAFVLNPGAQPGAEPGVWAMEADGSQRRRAGEYGAPYWSPDGREFLINSFSPPTDCLVMNLETKRGAHLKVPGHQIFSYPSWAGPGTLVSALATREEGDSIALLDVTNPAEAKIIEVLWQRGDELDVTPRWPVYWPETGRCYFVGVEPSKRALYSLDRGKSRRAKQVEAKGQDDKLGGLSFSPDGRYLLMGANRP